MTCNAYRVRYASRVSPGPGNHSCLIAIMITLGLDSHLTHIEPCMHRSSCSVILSLGACYLSIAPWKASQSNTNQIIQTDVSIIMRDSDCISARQH